MRKVRWLIDKQTSPWTIVSACHYFGINNAFFLFQEWPLYSQNQKTRRALSKPSCTTQIIPQRCRHFTPGPNCELFLYVYIVTRLMLVEKQSIIVLSCSESFWHPVNLSVTQPACVVVIAKWYVRGQLQPFVFCHTMRQTHIAITQNNIFFELAHHLTQRKTLFPN